MVQYSFSKKRVLKFLEKIGKNSQKKVSQTKENVVECKEWGGWYLDRVEVGAHDDLVQGSGQFGRQLGLLLQTLGLGVVIQSGT